MSQPDATETAVRLRGIARTFGDRRALDDVSFEVRKGEIFGLLGPNGGGKTTLFRILGTLLPATSGTADILGHALPGDESAVRQELGIVFQSPSLDDKLTVRENLIHQGHLYGLRGADLAERVKKGLAWVGLSDRTHERVEKLSGGLKRRAELAKGLLHDPRLVLLDEPSTGLDPAARRDLWQHLAELRDERGLTCLVTTHLMEEAELCDRVGILDRGHLVAIGTPDELRAGVGGEVVTVSPSRPSDLSDLVAVVSAHFDTPAQSVGGVVRVETEGAAGRLPALLGTLGDRAASVSVGRPTLLDLFLQKTGREWS